MVRQVARVTCGLMLLPVLGMQLSTEVNWGPADFFVAAVLLFSAGLIYRLVAAQLPGKAQRTLLAVLVVTLLALIWAELAVGLFS